MLADTDEATRLHAVDMIAMFACESLGIYEEDGEDSVLGTEIDLIP